MCLRSIWNRTDIIVCLPTGYGKSLIYDILPYDSNGVTVVIVITPLNAIVTDIIARHQGFAMKLSHERISINVCNV
jgi:superfamily II DNA helicase RecQ